VEEGALLPKSKPPLPPPPRQCAAALKQIEPKPERRAQCEFEIIRAIHCINLVKLNAPFSPPRLAHNARQKRRLLDHIKKLQSIEKYEHAEREPQIYSFHYLGQTRRERERLQEWASSIVIRPASKWRDLSRQLAAVLAHDLIADFSHDRPSVTRYGPWHELANRLSGAGADLFEEVREHRQLLAKDGAKADRIGEALRDLLQYLPEDHSQISWMALDGLFWALHQASV
jgi:hypothetical protein